MRTSWRCRHAAAFLAARLRGDEVDGQASPVGREPVLVVEEQAGVCQDEMAPRGASTGSV